MLDIPVVKLDEIIEIGERKPLSLRAVVCSTHYEKTILHDIEVAYDQDGCNLVKVEVVWDGENWQFKDLSVMGVRLSDSESYKFKNILKNKII